MIPAAFILTTTIQEIADGIQQIIATGPDRDLYCFQRQVESVRDSDIEHHSIWITHWSDAAGYRNLWVKTMVEDEQEEFIYWSDDLIIVTPVTDEYGWVNMAEGLNTGTAGRREMYLIWNQIVADPHTFLLTTLTLEVL